VQDESLIEEMRSALKGDRDRAEIRRAAPAERPEPAATESPPGAPQRRGLIARFARRRARG
jgi:hypothetical protein